ncbi:hypothetical protein L211DRAFT_783861 [Terfezia boudieri ATCC MYA-4762]|uniref:Peptide hydrolase n=1 Tax=Terfezia boudieri ATCC MYA-4762 TaxID=1051890 RepID=A0A3N4LPV8_9PEZI|nr:hypothetical protein L211DRAFT_783861 [Terfezia boudieri ATCC MYA-4762]
MAKILSLLLAVLPLSLALSTTPLYPEFDASDTRPLVESNKLCRMLTRSRLLHHAGYFQSFAVGSKDGNRGFGGIGHNATVAYLFNEVSKLSEWYDVYLQPFSERYSGAIGSFVVDGDVEVFYAARGSPSVKNLKAELGVAKGDGCNSSDFGSSLAGKIVLLQRGNCTITLKSQLGRAAGAAAVVVYNSVLGTVLDGRVLDVPNLVPTGAMGMHAGLGLVKRINRGEILIGEMNIDSFSEMRNTVNVIAETKTGNKSNVIMVGAHSDSVPLGPGINDNGSGSISILEVLLQLKNFKTNNAIRFGFFSAEEFGLLGAHYYVNQLTPDENLKIAMYLNFDMIASPNYIFGIYDGDGSSFNLTGPAGSNLIEYTFEAYYKGAGLKSVPTAFTGRSDYGPFLEANIPSGGLFTGAEGIKTLQEAAMFGGEAGEPYDVNYHQPEDMTKNCNVGAWIANTKAVADIIAKYGRSTEGFPERKLIKKKAKREGWSHGTHGHNHDHSEGGCGDGLY